MSDEPTVGLFHEVDDEEADRVIASMEHSIPHNEAIGRVLRNMYSRIKKLEADASKNSKRSDPLFMLTFVGESTKGRTLENLKIFGDRF